MRRLRSSSEAEMVALFLRTELSAARFRDKLRELLDGFPHDVWWEWMAITPAELATVRYIDYDYWIELSGGTRLAVDAAPRIRAGVAPFGVSSDWALGMAQAFADGARFPPLILVTTGPSGDLVVLEGHVRLTAYMLRPDRLPPELEVLVGSSPNAAGWGACSSRLVHLDELARFPDIRCYRLCYLEYLCYPEGRPHERRGRWVTQRQHREEVARWASRRRCG